MKTKLPIFLVVVIMLTVLALGVTAQADTQFSFFDSFASKKQYLIFLSVG